MASQGVGSNVANAAVDVDTTAVIVAAGRTIRKSVIIQNAEPATNIVYLGGSASVTTANGLALGPGESIRFDECNGPIWAIADTADTDVRVFEVY